MLVGVVQMNAFAMIVCLSPMLDHALAYDSCFDSVTNVLGTVSHGPSPS